MNAIMQHKSQAEGMLEKMEEPSEDVVIEQLKERLGKEKFYIWNFNK